LDSIVFIVPSMMRGGAKEFRRPEAARAQEAFCVQNG
jgi:hypothetical protein